MDLAQIKVTANEGEWLPIYMPDDVTVILHFLMVGRDSNECKEAGKIATANIRKSKGNMKPEQIEADNKLVVAACIKSWRGAKEGDPVIYDNENLDCTKENKLMLFDKLPFVYRQADSYIIEDENFFKV
jgi:hypothetical protein